MTIDLIELQNFRNYENFEYNFKNNKTLIINGYDGNQLRIASSFYQNDIKIKRYNGKYIDGKYIYGDGTPEIIDFPTKFLYPTTSIEKFLDTKNFTVKKALEKYPLPDNIDENSPVYKYFLQAKEDIKRTY